MFGKLKKAISEKASHAVPDTVTDAKVPSGPIPIPYPNIGPAGEAKEIPPTLRHQLETSFGKSLKDVKVYENHAPSMIGAKAFTSGKDIFLSPGSFNVMAEGKQLIRHECAHVLQQTGEVVNSKMQEAIDDGKSLSE